MNFDQKAFSQLKAAPFVKIGLQFASSPSREMLTFLKGLFLLSFLAGCWIYYFSPQELDNPFVGVPFFGLTLLSLLPVFVYGTHTALGNPLGTSYFAYFMHKDAWRVLSAQGIVLFASAIFFFVLHVVASIFMDTETSSFYSALERGFQLFLGSFSCLIFTHAATGRLLKVREVLKIASCGLSVSLVLFGLFFMLPIIATKLLELLVVLGVWNPRGFSFLGAGLFHGVMMTLFGYWMLSGCVALGHLYQTLADLEVTTK